MPRRLVFTGEADRTFLGYSWRMRIPSLTAAPARTLSRAGLALTLAVILGLAAPSASSGATAPSPSVSRPAPVVAILLSPYLTFADVSPSATPSLWSLAENGAVGSINAMTADPGQPTIAGGALTLSAGRWASAAETGAADAPSLPALQAANEASRARPTLGALGDAVHAAGGRTVAVGTSDPGTGTATVLLRPAELVATDSEGRIDFRATGNHLLVADRRAPLGVRTDVAALSSAIATALAQLATAPGPGGLLVVDAGDLSRAHAAESRGGEDAAPDPADREIGLASLDAAAAELVRQLPSDSLLLVVTPTTSKPYYQPPQFGLVIASGRGLTGQLTSASTHRVGLVTSLDVAPTALAALDVPAPPTMIGSSISSRPDPAPLAERIAALARTNDAVGAVDKLRDLYFTPAFVWFAIVCVGIALAAAFSSNRWISRGGAVAVLAVLSAPAAAWIALFEDRYPATPTAAGVSFAVAWLATCALSVLAARLVRPEAAVAGLSAVTAGAILADQWFAGPLQSGLFSYSVRAGWRYYGIGNEGSALAVAATVAALGLACDLSDGSPWAARLRRWGFPVAGAIVLATAAAPFAGANAGVAVWGFASFAVAWLRVNQFRFTARTVAWTVAATLLLVGVMAAIDLLGVGGGTHIGRFFLELAGGGSGAWELVQRKALNNLDYVTRTPYSWLAAALVGALVVERWVGQRPLASALGRYPAYAGALAGIVVGSVVALLTEDSGIVMPALMLLAGALPGLAILALGDSQAAASSPHESLNVTR